MTDLRRLCLLAPLALAWLAAVRPAAAAGAAPPLAADPVLPPARDGLRFDHGRHRQLECGGCHPRAAMRVRLSASELPGHAACVGCHPAADSGGARGSACRRCHRGPPRASKRPPAALHFSHAAHGQRVEACTACHDPRSGRPLARHADCAGCHRAWTSAGRCANCHPAQPGDRLVLDGPGGRLRPRGGHGGGDHGPGWQQGHGPRARGQAEACAHCHPQDHCDRCHRGVRRPWRQHPGDWELTHATVARGDSERCMACHRSQSDCRGCHQRAGLTRSEQPRPDGRRIHPPDFKLGAVHGREARRNLRRCSGCHAEADCIRCHGAAGRGLGISPHPPGFAGRCSLMRRRNPRPCAKCHRHDDLERLCP